jgi:polysaccharide export outer membrane protein
MSRFLPVFVTALLLLAAGPLRAAEPAPAASPALPAPAAGTDPNYRLIAGDAISITIYNEPDLTVLQTIARSGEVRLPLIGEIILIGLSVREAERLLEKTYRDRQFLRKPVASLTVTSYFPREVSVLGAVRTPGNLVFPRDVTSLDIVEVITRVGGFIPVSKADAVTITHRAPDGKETVTVVDLENTITGRRQSGRGRADLAIYPGDRIWVPERLF